MPLLLSRTDLSPLAEDDEALDDVIDAVQESLLRSHAGDRGETTFTGIALRNGDELASQLAASSSSGASMRLFPRIVRGARRNAWLGIRIDAAGEIESVIALDELNELRTSVPAAVGVRHLAPKGATTLAVLGSGAQARSHARTFARVMPSLEAVRVWSPTKAHREAFAHDMAARLQVRATAEDTAGAAVDGADVITAAGRTVPGQPAVPNPTAVRPGALFVSMTAAGMNLLPLGARLVVPTSQRPQLVAHGFSSGFLREGPPPAPPTAMELAEIILDDQRVRRSPTETMVYELAAPYLWDLPILAWITDWAKRHGVGTDFAFSD
jgi:alanine dehydrogenase